MRHSVTAIEGNVYADSFGYLLGSYFGAYDYTATSGGNPTTYAFSGNNSGNAQPTPYLFYDYNPGNSNTRVLARAIVTDLSIKADPGSWLSYSGSIMAFASGVVSNPATIPPVFSSFKAIPSRVGYATIGGTAQYKVTSYELSLKRGESGPIDTLQGIQDPLTIFVGPVQCTAKTAMVVDDDVQLLNYLNGSQPSFSVTVLQGATTAANGVKIQNTLANYESTKVGQVGKAYVTLDTSYTAVANTTDASTAGGGKSPVMVTLSVGTTTGSTTY